MTREEIRQAVRDWDLRRKKLTPYLKQRHEPKWIPCSEMLPDEGRTVLICINDGSKCGIDVSYRMIYDIWKGHGRLNENTVAWMPLPEPMKARNKKITKEEAIKMLKSKIDGHTDTSYEWAETVRMAIKALEQPKTGHLEWVQYDCNPKIGNLHCSECRSIVVECVYKSEKGGIPLYKYCPQCGAKMIESQESEEEKEDTKL